MGMTIDECYEWVRNAKIIMRKYKQIEQIIDNWKSDGGAFEMSKSYWLNQIKEVVEDGKSND